MSVLACNRYGCNNIMCDRYSKEHGYICYECFEELTKKGINADIYKFMKSQKKDINELSKIAFERFNIEFPL